MYNSYPWDPEKVAVFRGWPLFRGCSKILGKVIVGQGIRAGRCWKVAVVHRWLLAQVWLYYLLLNAILEYLEHKHTRYENIIKTILSNLKSQISYIYFFIFKHRLHFCIKFDFSFKFIISSINEKKIVHMGWFGAWEHKSMKAN